MFGGRYPAVEAVPQGAEWPEQWNPAVNRDRCFEHSRATGTLKPNTRNLALLYCRLAFARSAQTHLKDTTGFQNVHKARALCPGSNGVHERGAEGFHILVHVHGHLAIICHLADAPVVKMSDVLSTEFALVSIYSNSRLTLPYLSLQQMELPALVEPCSCSVCG